MAKRHFFQIEKQFSFSFDGFEKTKELIHNLSLDISEIVKEIDFDSFILGISWPVSTSNVGELRKSVQYALIEEISSKLSKKVDFNKAEAHFVVDFIKKCIILELLPVFICGNYCKYSRKIAQTQHFSKSSEKMEESVEQLLAEIIVPIFSAEQLVLHGAGREDADVLMLGKGRPFVAEIVFPKKRSVDLKKIEKEINSKFKDKISVNSLIFCDKEKVVETKNTLHDKKYLAIVECELKPNLKILSLNKKLKVEQKTPQRVEKRRADLLREKEIILEKATLINEKEFELIMKTSHGTYVKEFISGDEERTKPSISLMLKQKCVCKQLDVLEIL